MRIHLRTIVLLVALAALTSARAATNHFACGANSGFSAYIINAEFNPDLTLVRGFTYTFILNATGHPFWIKTIQGTGTGNAYNPGVTGNGTQNGTVTFSVPTNAPNLLYYNCEFHIAMTGKLNIIDSPNVQITEFNVGLSAVIHSTGTDALNVNVQTSTNLSPTVWQDATIQSNVYQNGTNTTHVDLPASDDAFFQVEQGFF